MIISIILIKIYLIIKKKKNGTDGEERMTKRQIVVSDCAGQDIFRNQMRYPKQELKEWY